MEINENLVKLIFREFDDSIKGTDIYNHDGSMWLIFTEERKWVIEFTNQKTLWYNYKHFTDILVLFGMEVSDGAEYIKKWYEDKFIFNVGKNSERYINESLVDNIIDKGVKQTELSKRDFFPKDVLQNGAKEVKSVYIRSSLGVGDAIQYGVKHTERSRLERQDKVEYTIQNGVKNSQSFDGESLKLVEDAIQNGVKNTQWGYLRDPWVIENTIQNGVKNIYGNKHYTALGVENTIQNGVKHTEWGSDLPTHKIKDTIENGVKEISSVDCEYPRATENVIKNGVKYMMSGSEFKNKQVEDIIKYSEKL